MKSSSAFRPPIEGRSARSTPSKAKPRKSFLTGSIKGLAAGISTDGLLQNLMVRAAKDQSKRYAIVAGE